MISPNSTPASTVAATLCTTDEAAAQGIADLLVETFAQETAVSLSDAGGGSWQVAVHFRTGPIENRVRALVAAVAGTDAAFSLRFERLDAKDWVRESLAGLKPVAAGRFIVHGAHDRARIPINRIGIEVEAALAFGTGHHGTTRGCLLALDRLCKLLNGRRGRPRILDLGTGSGVLAIAAARALRRPVLASDVDSGAVRAARANTRLNCVGALVEIVTADGVSARRLRTRAPFDLILANILLAPLQRLARPLQNLAAPGARLVLSGLLPAQASAALAAYRSCALERRIDLDGWTTLVLMHRPRRRRKAAP